MERVWATLMGESRSLLGERSEDSLASEGNGDTGAICVLPSFSSVENETVFLRFLRGGTRTTGDEGRGYGGDGGRLVRGAVSALMSLAPPERNMKVVIDQQMCKTQPAN